MDIKKFPDGDRFMNENSLAFFESEEHCGLSRDVFNPEEEDPMIVIKSLIPMGLTVALVALASSGTSAQAANEGVCDVLHGTTKGLYGLCVAFCEAQDCTPTFDETTGELTFPKHCPPSSPKTLAKYNSRKLDGDPDMPCINVEPGGCPCWTEAEIDLVADGDLRFCQDAPTLTILQGEDAVAVLSTELAAAVINDSTTNCTYWERTPDEVYRYQAVDQDQYAVCRDSVKAECGDRGFPLP